MAWLLILAVGLLHAPLAAATDYEAELQAIDSDLADAERVVGPERALRRAGLSYRRAALTADFHDLRKAEVELEEAMRAVGAVPELLWLRANLHYKVHRFDAAERDLQTLGDELPGVASLRADIALQRGRYDEARRGYLAAIERRGKWDDLARLAYLQSRTGRYSAADETYARAEGEISAKEMRLFAWVELQRGILDLEQRRYEAALAHYRRAERAYSGYWLIDEHIAEVLDLMGRSGEAERVYERIIGVTRNPEYVSALARIVARRDRAAADVLYAEADRLHEERLAVYPEAATGHLLRDALARDDARSDLLQLAMRNYELRPNGESKLLLARAYMKRNERETAGRLLDEIAATEWRTRELEELRRR